jgi:hypothetical protein
MSETHTTPGSGSSEAVEYEIRVKGRLEPRWVTWFDGLTLTSDDKGSTVIHGVVADQAALHGLLQKVRDTGLPLVSVAHVPRSTDLT